MDCTLLSKIDLKIFTLDPVEINIAGPSMLWKKQGEILDLRCTIKHRDNISPIGKHYAFKK